MVGPDCIRVNFFKENVVSLWDLDFSQVGAFPFF